MSIETREERAIRDVIRWREKAQALEARVKELEAIIPQYLVTIQGQTARAEKAEADLAAVSHESLAWQSHLVQSHSCTHVVEIKRAAGRESGEPDANTPGVRKGVQPPREPRESGPEQPPLGAAAKSPARHTSVGGIVLTDAEAARIFKLARPRRMGLSVSPLTSAEDGT
ncbi:MAG TPA: hypothetical protein VJN63_05640 [Thermoplasmata archaeon]|nr:hypothetical protein [Thermoplasmata archaeon]